MFFFLLFSTCTCTQSVLYTALKRSLLCIHVEYSCIQTNGAFVCFFFFLSSRNGKKVKKERRNTRTHTIESLLLGILCVKYVRRFIYLCSAAPYLHLYWLNLIDIFCLIFYGRFIFIYTYSILSDAIIFSNIYLFLLKTIAHRLKIRETFDVE